MVGHQPANAAAASLPGTAPDGRTFAATLEQQMAANTAAALSGSGTSESLPTLPALPGAYGAPGMQAPYGMVAALPPADGAHAAGAQGVASAYGTPGLHAAYGTPQVGYGATPFAPPVSSKLVGDLDGMSPDLRAGLEQVAAQLGTKLEVISGHRSHAEQQVLYDRYLAGTGNLAAKPGTSRHETGRAADVYVNGVALANVPGARKAAAAAGLGFPVPGEAWHVERLR